MSDTEELNTTPPEQPRNEHGGRAFGVKASPAPANSPLRKMLRPPAIENDVIVTGPTQVDDSDYYISTGELIDRLAEVSKQRDELKKELGILAQLALIASTLPESSMRVLVSVMHDYADRHSTG